MPITMMFAADQIGRKYLDYSLDSRVLAEAQIQTATAFDFDHVSCIAETREAPDCGAEVEYFEDQPPAVVASRVLLQDKSVLGRLKAPYPYTGERMSDRLNGVRILKERIGRDKIVEGWVEGPCAVAARGQIAALGCGSEHGPRRAAMNAKLYQSLIAPEVLRAGSVLVVC
jgi:uroporphyrinogen-III decarboxylase